MSSLIVEVCTIEEIQPHSGADRLERARIKNWWVVVGKDSCRVNDKVVYVPPDALVPKTVSDKWGITKYCASVATEPDKVRVRACRLRQVPSFGTIQPPDDPNWEVGTNVAEHYGITKYEPPVKAVQGDAAPEIPFFHKYTSIENLGHYPRVIKEGELVVATEKLHGTNSRVGYVLCEADGFPMQWRKVAGSHSVRRKEFNEHDNPSSYWMPFNTTPMADMLEFIRVQENAEFAVIAFGEIFGVGIQDMSYGQSTPSYRMFDISVDGRYLDHDVMKKYADDYGILTVPLIYEGPYSLAQMDLLVDGPTTICSPDQIKEPFKGREGIVVKPKKERIDHEFGGRVILKYVSVDYHDRKNKDRSEDH